MTNKTKTVTLADDKALTVLSDEERRITNRLQEKVTRQIPFKDGAPAEIGRASCRERV